MTKTGAALAVLALACTAGAHGQTSESTAFGIGVCAAQTDPQARLACYDQLAARLKAGAAPQAAAAPPMTATPPVAFAPPVGATPPVASAPPAAPAPAAAPPAQSFGLAAPPPKDEHAWYDVGSWFGGGSEKPAPTGPVQPPSQFGAEQLPKDQPATAEHPAELEEITAKVTGVAFSRTGRFTVTLANGQMWAQLEGDTDVARFGHNGGDTVTISRGMFGSYNLVVDGHNGMYKVRRIQ